MKKTKKGKQTEDVDVPDTLTAEEQEILKNVEEGKVEDITVEEEKSKDEKYSYYRSLLYDIDPDDGLVYKDYDIISKQRKLIFTLIKQIGANIVRGKSIMNVSLPVYIFEPYSLLDRTAALFCYVPSMIEPIVDIVDPIERMKMLMTWSVSTLHIGIGQKKPFNPILGETYQGKIGDLSIYFEQTEHHPPIAHYLIVGKNLKMHGKYQIVAHTYPNSAKAATYGRRCFEIKGKNPCRYTVTYPEAEITGMMFGRRTFKYIDDYVFKDKTNKIYALIRFNPLKQGFFSSIFSKKAYRDDHIKGFITKNKELLSDTSESVFESKDIISHCEGNWIDNLFFDGKLYWELGKYTLTPLVGLPNKLRSDATLRPDLQALAKGNEKESQRLKEIMENVQRNDAKLREHAAKAKAKSK